MERPPARMALVLTWLGAGAVFLVDFTQAQAQTLDVASAEALAQAIGSAGPGSVIRLAPGDYGALTLRDLDGGPDAPIVMVSADPAHPAMLSRLILRDVAHLELRDLTVDYAFAPDDPPHLRVVDVNDSRDVTMTGLLLDGDVARGISPTSDGFPTAYGLGVLNVEGFTLVDSEIRGFYRGVVASSSSDVTLIRNDLHGLRMDGMILAALDRVLIEGNWIHDFDRSVDSGDHPDMIQFFTNGTDRPSTDITIRHNLLNSGSGAWTQSVFMHNEEVDQERQSFDAMAYRGIRIEDNVIINAHLHGITVGETDGLLITGNAILRNPLSEGEDDNPGLWTPQVRVSSGARDVQISRNVVAKITGFEGQPDWLIEENLLAQDRTLTEPNNYSLVFEGMQAGDPRDPASFVPKPGGLLDGTGIGPTWLGRRAPP